MPPTFAIFVAYSKIVPCTSVVPVAVGAVAAGPVPVAPSGALAVAVARAVLCAIPVGLGRFNVGMLGTLNSAPHGSTMTSSHGNGVKAGTKPIAVAGGGAKVVVGIGVNGVVLGVGVVLGTGVLVLVGVNVGVVLGGGVLVGDGV